MSKLMTNVSSDICDSPEFRTDFEQLTRREFAQDFEQILSESQLKRLLEASAILSLSDNDNHLKLAYKSAVYLLKQYELSYPSLSLVIELILTRLGDLPAIRHVVDSGDGEDYFRYFENVQQSDLRQNIGGLSVSTRFPEVLKKKIFNQVITSKERILSLTDFQADLLRTIRAGNGVAFSAPTSAGKSFVLLNYISEKLHALPSYCVFYLVPTKALVAEVQSELVLLRGEPAQTLDAILVLTG